MSEEKPQILSIRDIVKSTITGHTHVVIEEYIDGRYFNVIRPWDPCIADLKVTRDHDEETAKNLTKRVKAIDDLIMELEVKKNE